MILWPYVLCVGLIPVTTGQALGQPYEFDLTFHQPDLPWLTCPQGWNIYGTDCFKVFPEAVSFSEAFSVCTSVGSNLVYIKGLNKNRHIGSVVRKQLEGNQPFWIGLQRKHSGTFQWTNGHTAQQYEGIWEVGQPEVIVKQSGLDLCVTVETTTDQFRWSLKGCDTLGGFVCEVGACGVDSFRCSDGACIPAGGKCDGERDCRDGEDELHCGQEQCGGTLTSPDLPIQFPSSPGVTYAPYQNCHWKINAPIGKKILLKFTDLNTEAIYDVVKVFDGPSLEDPVLGTFSGNTTNRTVQSRDTTHPNVTSTTNILLLTFSSDHSVEGRGFNATWEPVAASDVEERRAKEELSWIASLGYPFGYQGNLKYSWIIRTDPRVIISIHVLYLDLAEGDSLKLFDGETRESSLLRHYNGQLRSELLFTTGQAVYLMLTTDLYHSGQGFNVTYQKGCDVTMTTGFGRITSPGYSTGNQYPANLRCTVALRDALQRKTTLIFHNFDTEEEFDTVKVYNSTTLLKTLSGRPNQTIFTSHNGEFHLQFQTDGRVSESGWNASFSFGCNDNRSHSAHTITTPGWVEYGQSANYSCDTGYRLVGASHSYCDMGGVWRTDPPTCKLIYCGPPEPLANGVLLNVTSRYMKDRGTANYSCLHGYTMIGSETVPCTEKGWGKLPECAGIECPKLKPLPNGRTLTPYFYHHLRRVEFVCERGFHLVGNMYTECIVNSSRMAAWSSPHPACVADIEPFCKEIIVLNGRVNQTGPIRLGQFVHVTCNHGYQLNGSYDGVICNASGVYDKSIPKCYDVDECSRGVCGEDICINTVGSYWCQCRPGYHHRSVTEPNCTDIDECAAKTSDCKQKCDNTPGGYQCGCWAGARLYTSSQVVMLGTTVLVPNVSCYTLCPGNFSEEFEIFETIEPVSDGSYIASTRLVLGCYHKPPQIIECQSNGTWSKHVEKCDDITCNKINSPINGKVEFTSAQRLLGSYAWYTCDLGFFIQGNPKRYCDLDLTVGQPQGKWTGTAAICIAVECGTPPAIINGDVLSTGTKYRSTVTYTCHYGYRLAGDNVRTCLHTAMWSTQQIHCIAEVCPRPVVMEHASVGHNGLYYLRQNVSFSCPKEGYKISDPFPLQCVLPVDITHNSVRLPVYKINVTVTLNLTKDAYSNGCKSYYNRTITEDILGAVKNSLDEITAAGRVEVCAVVDTRIVVQIWSVSNATYGVSVKVTIVLEENNSLKTTAIIPECVNRVYEAIRSAKLSSFVPFDDKDTKCPTLQADEYMRQTWPPEKFCRSGNLDNERHLCVRLTKDPAALLMVDLDLVTNSTAATSSCFGNISLLLQSSVRSVVNRWQSGTHCVENYIFSLDHVTGSISVTDFGITLHMPVFLKNADSSYRMSQNCVQNITKKFKQEMVKTIEDALESITKLCPNFTANYSKLDALTPLIMCRQGFQFHENSGQCMYCHDCDTGIATSLITTLSTTTPGLTTTTAALTTTTFGLTTTSLGFTTTTHGLTTTELKTTVTVPSTTTPIVPTTSMEPTTTTDAGTCGKGYGLSTSLNVTCSPCQAGRYNNGSGNNPNICKICPEPWTNNAIGSTDCPIKASDSAVSESRFYTIVAQLDYEATVAECNNSISEVYKAVNVSVHKLFISRRDEKYNGTLSFCKPGCENLVVTPSYCRMLGASARERREDVAFIIGFNITFYNVSGTTKDIQGNEDLPTVDVIVHILRHNQKDLDVSNSTSDVAFSEFHLPPVLEICRLGFELVNSVCEVSSSSSSPSTIPSTALASTATTEPSITTSSSTTFSMETTSVTTQDTMGTTAVVSFSTESEPTSTATSTAYTTSVVLSSSTTLSTTSATPLAETSPTVTTAGVLSTTSSPSSMTTSATTLAETFPTVTTSGVLSTTSSPSTFTTSATTLAETFTTVTTSSSPSTMITSAPSAIPSASTTTTATLTTAKPTTKKPYDFSSCAIIPSGDGIKPKPDLDFSKMQLLLKLNTPMSTTTVDDECLDYYTQAMKELLYKREMEINSHPSLLVSCYEKGLFVQLIIALKLHSKTMVNVDLNMGITITKGSLLKTSSAAMSDCVGAVIFHPDIKAAPCLFRVADIAASGSEAGTCAGLDMRDNVFQSYAMLTACSNGWEVLDKDAYTCKPTPTTATTTSTEPTQSTATNTATPVIPSSTLTSLSTETTTATSVVFTTVTTSTEATITATTSITTHTTATTTATSSKPFTVSAIPELTTPVEKASTAFSISTPSSPEATLSSTLSTTESPVSTTTAFSESATAATSISEPSTPTSTNTTTATTTNTTAEATSSSPTPEATQATDTTELTSITKEPTSTESTTMESTLTSSTTTTESALTTEITILTDPTTTTTTEPATSEPITTTTKTLEPTTQTTQTTQSTTTSAIPVTTVNPYILLECFVCANQKYEIDCEKVKESCPTVHFKEPVCYTKVNYASRQISKIDKGCMDQTTCERLMNSNTFCTASLQSPECHYCCSTAECNKQITKLDFGGKGRRKKRSFGWQAILSTGRDHLKKSSTGIKAIFSSGNHNLNKRSYSTQAILNTGKSHMKKRSTGSEANFSASTALWNGSSPSCIDIFPPYFVNCPNEPIIIKPGEVINVSIPSAKDNSGLQPTISTEPQNFTLPFFVLKDTIIRITASDEMLNSAVCNLAIRVKDSNPCKIPVVPEGVDFTEKHTGKYEATCKQHGMSVVPPSMMYTCSNETGWSQTFVPDCVPEGSGECPVWRYNLTWNVMPEGVMPEGMSCNFTPANLALIIQGHLNEPNETNIRLAVESNIFSGNGPVYVLRLVLNMSENQIANTNSCENLTRYQESLNNLSLPKGVCTTGVTLLNVSLAVNTKLCMEGLVLPELDQKGMCWPCPKGFEARNARCQPCGIGYYSPGNYHGNGTYRCIQCPEGLSTIGSHSTNIADCIKMCTAGSYSLKGLVPCAPCPRNYYQPGTKSGSCLPCPNSTCTQSVGTSSKKECQAAYCPTACSINPCRNGGTCYEALESYKCSCPTGFTGRQCALNVDSCDHTECHFGHCGVRDLIQSNTPFCYCFPGFTGSRCDVNIDDCINNGCLNGGKCEDLVNNYTCNCTGTGYQGNRCTVKIEYCLKFVCENGGTKIESVDGCKCSCSPELYGSFCELRHDPCSNFTCNQGRCLLNNTQPYCMCQSNYTGKHCETSLLCNASYCNSQGVCLRRANGHECICDPGYTGEMCQDAIIGSPCDQHICNQSNMLDCIEMNKSPKCICKSGWTGETCSERVDVCAISPCLHGGTCVPRDDHYLCNCSKGFAGPNCEFTPCFSLPCLNGATCVVTSSMNYTCTCTAAFTGVLCEQKINFCSSKPCGLQGNCLDHLNGYQCLCYSGWSGPYCDTPVSPCVTRPCQNNGTCTETKAGVNYTCNCPQGYTGFDCESIISACQSNPCLNRGTCSDLYMDTEVQGRSYMCACLPGYHGYTCDENRAACAKGACQNGGVCVAQGNTTVCNCPARFMGIHCEKERPHDYEMLITQGRSLQCHVDRDLGHHGNLSVCAWLRQTSSGRDCVFLQVQGHSNRTLLEMSRDTVKLSFWKENATLSLPTNLNNSDWHQLCVVLSNLTGNWMVIVDGAIRHAEKSQVGKLLTGVKVTVGNVYHRPDFQGQISGVKVHGAYLILTDLDLTTCNSRQGNLISWTEFESCVHDNGSSVAPASCPVSKCVSGMDCGNVKAIQDKTSPVVKYCPVDIIRIVSNGDRQVNVTWSEPIFHDNQANVTVWQSHQSGQAFTFGEYLVTYTAFDPSSNMATCSFRIFVQAHHCLEPEAPSGGDMSCDPVGNAGMVCSISCKDDSAFLEPVPNLYMCGLEGIWDPPRGRTFNFPQCSSYTSPILTYSGSLIVIGSSDKSCTDSEKSHVACMVLTRASHSGMTGRLCRQCSSADCDLLAINVDCLVSPIAKRSTQPVQFHVNFTFYQNSSATIDSEAAMNVFESSLKNGMEDFSVQNLSMTTNMSCDMGQVLTGNKCVNCAKGYYYKASECIRCPQGWYTDKELQHNCTRCDQGKTTLSTGSVSPTDCFLNCTVGHYELDGACEQCEVGTYQPGTGAKVCFPCPIGYTTLTTEATHQEQCIAVSQCSMCVDAAVCVSKGNQVTCQCPQGFTWRDNSCVDDCLDACVHGSCDKDSSGNPVCKCDAGYQGLKCDVKQAGLTTAVIAAIGGSTLGLVLILAVVVILCCKRHFQGYNQKDDNNSSIYRRNLRNSFRAFALRMNPRWAETESMASEGNQQIRLRHLGHLGQYSVEHDPSNRLRGLTRDNGSDDSAVTNTSYF